MNNAKHAIQRVGMGLTLNRLVTAIVFIAIFTMAVRVPVDSDTWWHLRSGQWIVEHGAIPRTDSFSHTQAGEPWIDHSWLAQIILFLTFDTFGYAGLALLVAFLVTLAFLFVWLQCSPPGLAQRSAPVNGWLRAFTIIIAAATSGVIWVARPQMFSFAFTALTAMILHRFKQGDRKAIWFLPPLMLLWVNTHGGFAVGFILMVAYLFGEMGNLILGIKPNREEKQEGSDPGTGRFKILGQLVLVLFICLLIVPLNPNGVQMWSYPFRTVGMGVLKDFIAEWRPPDFHQLHLHPFIWMLLAALTAVGLSGRTADFTDLTLVALFTYMSLLAGRNIALFALVVAPVIIKYGSAALDAWRERMNWRVRPRTASMGKGRGAFHWSLLFLLILAAAIKIRPPMQEEINLLAQADSMPVDAVEFIRQNHPKGPIFNSYNWGGYLIWQLSEFPVFVDGRTDLYDDPLLREYLNIVFCQSGWKEMLDKRGINLVLIESQSALGQRLGEQSDWKEIYQDEMASVFTRE